MNILLINDNPVVNKLVTLSAQKTSDNLEVVESLDALESTTYDLVVIDDTLYSDALYMELNEKVTYSTSLYICSRDTEEVDGFTKILKKPFLPTDLVELFSVLSKESDEIDTSTLEEDTAVAEEEVLAELEDLGEIEELGEVEDLEDELEEIDELEDLDEELSLDDLEDDSSGESVLDDEEAQKVKDLLEETEMDINLDDELDLEELVLEDEPEDEEELVLEEEPAVEEEAEVELEEEPETEEEVELEEEPDIDIASQIENAVDDLSEEELESEIDEETLLDIVSGDLDSLTSKDIKLAMGEDVDEVEDTQEEQLEELTENEVSEEVTIVDEEIVDEKNSGVEALKNLLTALTDKNVAASMKGMKISINITLGDN